MSICYWGIVGYGIEISEKIFDEKKVLEKDKEIANEDGYEFHGFYFENFVNSISTDSTDTYLDYVNGGNNDGHFLIYLAKNPWNMSEKEKRLTKEDVKNEITRVLLPYLKDEYTEKWIKENVDYISTGGEG